MLHPEHTKACILVVDDNLLNVRLVELTLQAGGFTNLHATTDARQAIALLTDMQPDVVVTDLHMPDVDGFALIAEIRRRRAALRDVPIVVLTADSTREARQRALALGATQFLTKPWAPGDLLHCLLTCLEHWYPRPERPCAPPDDS